MIDAGDVFTPLFVGNTLKNFGSVSSISFSVGTDSTSNAGGIYDTENLNSLVPAANSGINMNDGLENHVIAGYYPYGYNDASTAYTSEAGKSANTKLLRVKINDSTANTGGVRLYTTNETVSNVFAGTATSTEATIDNLGSPTSNTTSNDFTYSFSADTSLTEDQDTDLSTSFNLIDGSTFIFQANQNVYLNITKVTNNIANHYRVQLGQVPEGVQDLRTQFLHPDDTQITGNGANAGYNNWRPKLYSILVFYNEYFIDGASGETITGDRLNLFHGVYRIFSTTSTVFQNFCRLDDFDFTNTGTDGLANEIADYNVKSVVYTGEDIFCRENVLGLVDSNYSAIKKDVAGHPQPQGEGYVLY